MNKYISILSFVFLSTTYFACIDQEFDSPPGFMEQEGDISNTTIAELKQMHEVGELSTQIPDGTIIKGTVVSNDATGNFFKDLVIQDESAGIHIRIDQSDLNTIYPPGREVFVDCDGLFIGDFGGLTQIGTEGSDVDNPSNVNRLPQILVPDKLILGQLGDSPAGTAKTIDELSSADLSTLVELQGVEIRDDEVGDTYAVPNGGSTQNRHLLDCDGNEVVLRNSDFADFAGEVLPGGNGTITGVYSIFGSTLQFTIRDLNDVNMNDARCDGSGGMNTGEIIEEDISNLTIADLLDMHTLGADASKVPAGSIIKGTVISSDEAGNFFKNLVIQDETGGIQIRVDVNDLYIDYELGRLVYVDCEDLYIGDFNGLPQLGIQGDGSSVNRISSNNAPDIILRGPVENLIQPAIKSSLSDITSDDINTLVTVTSVEYAEDEIPDAYAPEFSVNRIVEDCDGNTIIIRHSSFADFALEPLPEGNGDMTAIVGVFGPDLQLFINDTGDVNMNGDRCDGSGGGPFIDERFESQADFENISLSGWTNVSTTGIDVWEQGSFSGNGFAQATAFQATDAEVDAWLVTPELDFSMVSTMEFESAKAFYVQDGLSILFSSDFTGDVSAASWESVDVNIAQDSDPDFDWIGSGVLDLTSLSAGKGHIAFRYQGDPAMNTTTYRIDNVKVQ